MKRYAIQFKEAAWSKTYNPPTPEFEFDTLDEAWAAYHALGRFSQSMARIVEAYTVVRYKVVKTQ